MRLVGLIVCWAVVVWAIILGTPLVVFLDLSSVILLLGMGFGNVVYAHGTSSMGSLLRAVVLDPPAESASTIADFAHTANLSFVVSGWVCVLIGGIQMSSQWEGSADNLGPAMAVCLLSAFYGHLLQVSVWMPMERRLRTQAPS